jgi:hypothetical protein
MAKPNIFKRDKYKSARGGYLRLLNLHCRECETIFAEYQKDGPGTLRRLYMDRIVAPTKLVGLEKQNLKNISPIKCSKCKLIVGMPCIYKKENRKAFRIFQDAVIKRIKKTTT